MEQHGSTGPFGRLYASLKAGEITRRDFIERSTALGIGAGVAIFCANAAQVAARGGSRNGFAFYAQGSTAKAPDTGTESQKRGEGGELKLIQWQAPTLLSPQIAGGDKDFMAGQLVVEPLMHYLPDGTIIPNLIKEVPSVDNGLLAKDLSSFTLQIADGITWSDGEPFTAKDVIFTWKWITTPSNNAVNIAVWDVIKDITAKDDLTAVVTLKDPAANWFEPFVGGTNGPIYPAHKFKGPDDPNQAFASKPIGTGPYVVDSFTPGDLVVYSANEKYREPNKPYFAKVSLKGGGDAASAARAVLETGEYQFAWNLQVEPAILQNMESGGKGKVVTELGTSVERIHFNFSDPNKEVDGQRSHLGTPNPIFTDLKVRQALNMAVQRDVIATQFYGLGQPATANVLVGLKSFTSSDTKWEYNLDAAGKLLDEAGWKMEGSVRKKDGQELTFNYATTINQVRQKTQAVVKQAWSKLGCKVNLVQIDSGVFFDTSAGNDQNTGHFYWDTAMWTNNAASPIPAKYMAGWYAGKNNTNIAQKSNGWQGQNSQRWVNADYDALYDQLAKEIDFEKASALLIKMNDLVINEVAVIPEVQRSSDTYAIANELQEKNVAIGVGFEFVYWNIANWTKA